MPVISYRMPIFVSGLLLISERQHSPARRRQPSYTNLCSALHTKTTVAQTQHTGQEKFPPARRSTTQTRPRRIAESLASPKCVAASRNVRTACVSGRPVCNLFGFAQDHRRSAKSILTAEKKRVSSICHRFSTKITKISEARWALSWRFAGVLCWRFVEFYECYRSSSPRGRKHQLHHHAELRHRRRRADRRLCCQNRER